MFSNLLESLPNPPDSNVQGIPKAEKGFRDTFILAILKQLNQIKPYYALTLV